MRRLKILNSGSTQHEPVPHIGMYNVEALTGAAMNIINPPEPLTDAETLALWAQQALGERRYELAEAITRLAVQAARTERKNGRTVADALRDHKARQHVDVPFVGQTRDEAPVRDLGPTGNGDADLVAAAETAIFQRMPMAAPDTRRCEAVEITEGGVAVPCHGALTWQHGSVGDDQNAPTMGYWHHIHEHLDRQHDAKPALS